jgi:UDP:flavonoid glycosyltransferase YjiC (YdhE family)
MNGRLDVFRTIVAALAKHKDLQLVLSVGDQVDPKQIGPVPKNAIIVKRAPQLELLKQTSVCITHAGLNTVLESLTQGVPQIAIPVALDQPGVAARIADWLGARFRKFAMPWTVSRPGLRPANRAENDGEFLTPGHIIDESRQTFRWG